MRFLSSSRCSRKLIEAMRSGSVEGDSSSATGSGMGGGRVYVRRRRFRGFGGRSLSGKARGLNRAGRRHRRWQALLLRFVLIRIQLERFEDLRHQFFGLEVLELLQFELRNFGFDLRFELIGCALEFVERFADLAGNPRQLFGTEKEQGQNEQNNSVGKTHEAMITEPLASSNAPSKGYCRTRPLARLALFCRCRESEPSVGCAD